MRNRRFWGLAAITIGLLALLAKVEILPPLFAASIWAYWPLLLIIAGVLLWFKVRKSILIIAVVGALTMPILSPRPFIEPDFAVLPSNSFRMARLDSEGVQVLDVGLITRAGSFRVSGLDHGLYEVIGSGKNYRSPEHTYSLNEGVAQLRIKQGETNFVGKHDALWNLRFWEQVPLRVGINGGTGRFDLDFRSMRLEELKITCSAGKIKVAIGEALPAVNIELTTAAADVTLVFPRGARVELGSASLLSKLDLAAEDRWENQGDILVYPGAVGIPVIRVRISSGATRVFVKFA